MLQSEMPRDERGRSFCAKRRASSGVRMSGSVTSSISGVPARLKSTSDCVAPAMRPSPPTWTILPVSSSRWMRVMPTRRVASSVTPSASLDAPRSDLDVDVARRTAGRTGRSGSPSACRDRSTACGGTGSSAADLAVGRQTAAAPCPRWRPGWAPAARRAARGTPGTRACSARRRRRPGSRRTSWSLVVELGVDLEADDRLRIPSTTTFSSPPAGRRAGSNPTPARARTPRAASSARRAAGP